MERFGKILASANSSITLKDMQKIATSLSLNAETLKAKLTMSREAMETIREGAEEANEDAGLIEGGEETDAIVIARELVDRLDSKALDDAPRVVQNKRGVKKSPTIMLDDEPKQ